MKKTLLLTFLIIILNNSYALNIVGEKANKYLRNVPITTENQTSSSNLPPISLEKLDSINYLDLRGFGDSGWSWTHQDDPLPAEFGLALDEFDSKAISLNGDLNIMNWESVVAYSCAKWHAPYRPGRSYAFLSRPENISQAIERGINFFALSHNHTRDCPDIDGAGTPGQIATFKEINNIREDNPNFLWHGIHLVSDQKVLPAIKTFQVKGRVLKVAFASAYTSRESCPYATCIEDIETILHNLKNANVNFRILSLHSQGGQELLVDTAKRFIKDFNGDIVFGHGPHIWKPVRVIPKENGSRGVIFESLGNFLHPSMASQEKNIIGRALFDLNSLKLVQVQAIPIKNDKLKTYFSSANGVELPANLNWQKALFEIDDKKVHAVYSNIK